MKRGNKAFNIRENTYHVEADVAAFYEFRQYFENGDYRAGVALMTDLGGELIEELPGALGRALAFNATALREWRFQER